MKKFIGFIFVLAMFASIYQNVYADCITGYACSIEDLEKLDQLQKREFSYVIDKFFEKKIQAPIFLKQKKVVTNYNDLFVFHNSSLE